MTGIVITQLRKEIKLLILSKLNQRDTLVHLVINNQEISSEIIRELLERLQYGFENRRSSEEDWE